MQRLKLYKTTPDNGLVIFCGALPTNGPGSEVINLYEIVPPKQVISYLYACDDHFHLEELRDMLREEKVYGILAVDASEAGLGILSGETLEIPDVITSGISGKTRKGGQSARRYERGREMELTYYYHRIAEHATRVFMENAKVTGLVVGGPGPTKEDFLKGFLHYELQKKVIAVIDLGYSGREGVRELVEKASDVLKDVRLVEEKKLVQKFLFEVNKAGGLAVYGLPRVMDALQKANAEVVMVSDDFNTVRIEAKCKKCGTVRTEFATGSAKVQKKQEMISEPCSKCGGTEYEASERDVVDVLEEMAFQVGSRVEVISSGTEEGNMFKTFGGVAAILRYRTS
jgi:peptide chain release factor subunit 1